MQILDTKPQLCLGIHKGNYSLINARSREAVVGHVFIGVEDRLLVII